MNEITSLIDVINLITREANTHLGITTVQEGDLEKLVNIQVPQYPPVLFYVQWGEVTRVTGRDVVQVSIYVADVYAEEDKLTTVSSMHQIHNDVAALVKRSAEDCEIDFQIGTVIGLIPNQFPNNWTGVSTTWTIAYDAVYDSSTVPLKLVP